MRRVLLALMLLTAPAAAQTLPVIEDGAVLRPLTVLSERLQWQAIGRLDTGSSFCTATLIDSDTVLTAAHCLFNRQTGARFPDQVLTFRAGLTDGQAAATRSIAASVISPGFDFHTAADPSGIAHDVALLRLAEPIRHAEIRPLPLGASPREGDAVALVSYGRDREEVASLEEDCAVEASMQGVIVLSCRVDPGTSGAPVIALRQGQVLVVSVISASASLGEQPVGLAVDLTDRIAAMRTELAADVQSVMGGLPQVRTLVGDADGRDTIGAIFLRP